ncbi:unnamed protein product [Mucor circinelloides]
MKTSMIYKLISLFALICLVMANTESELEQPTKLLGGIIRSSTNCKQKVSGNSKVKLHYRARVWGSEEFYESTYLSEKPHSYKLGRDKLMKGLEQGILGMCNGEIRRLLIPADLAYGQMGLPNLVPGNTAVIYEVEMLEVNSPFYNPWFWAGLFTLGFGYFFMNRYMNMSQASSSSKFLEKVAKTD